MVTKLDPNQILARRPTEMPTHAEQHPLPTLPHSKNMVGPFHKPLLLHCSTTRNFWQRNNQMSKMRLDNIWKQIIPSPEYTYYKHKDLLKQYLTTWWMRNNKSSILVLQYCWTTACIWREILIRNLSLAEIHDMIYHWTNNHQAITMCMEILPETG